ncbi:MAG: hypothetical protein J0H35_06945, partial [Rhodospirillales bacterium]|nr:hypothetical protein [Rhodospirillales bacterium]
LGIRYAVSGTIRRAGDRMRIFVELADAVNANVLWARSYDAENMHLFDAQDSIVGQIVNTLVPRMQSAELARTRAKRPESLTAYDLVLQARDLVLRLEPATFERAGELLRQAIALDPGYAAGHAALAAWYSLRIGQGWAADPDREARALDSSAQAALACDRFNAQALALLGHNRTILDLEHDRAQELFSRAIDAAPNDASVWTWSSPTAAFIGDGPEAVRRAERALRLSPLDPFLFRIHHFLCIAHYTSGTYEDAVHWGMLSLRDAHHYTSSLRATAAALAALGRLAEAQEIARRAIDLQPEFRVSSILQRHPYRDPAMRRRYAQDLSSAGLLA